MSLVPRRLAPPRDEEVFSDWCLKIFRRALNCPDLAKHGRRGQDQGGLDHLGNDNAGLLVGVQCKLRNDGQLDTDAIDRDLEAALVSHPGISHVEFTTTQLRDAKVHSHVVAADSRVRRSHNCSVHISFWGEIEDLLHTHADLMCELNGGISGGDAKSIRDEVQSLRAELRQFAGVNVGAEHISQSPITPEVVRALEYVKKGQVDVAIAQLHELRELRWSSIDNAARFQLLKALGNAYYAKEDFAGSANWFLEARQCSDSVEAQCLEARAYQYRSELPRALVILDAVLKQEPNHAHAHAVRIFVVPVRYSELLESIPPEVRDDAEVALALSYRAFDEGIVDAAVEHARTAHRAAPNWHVAATHLGSMLIKLALESAIVSANEELVVDTTVVAEAEQILTGALKNSSALSPYSRAMALYNRSSVYKMLGRRAEGIQDIEEAERLQPNDPQILATLGVTLEKEGNLPQAIRIYERAVAISEHAVGVEILLALAFRQRGLAGDLEKAVGVLEQVKERARDEDESHRLEYVRILGQLRWQLNRNAYSPDRLPVDDLFDMLTDEVATVVRAWWLGELGDKVRASEALASLAGFGIVQGSRVGRLWLAEAFLKTGSPQRAVDALLPFTVSHVLTDETRLLLSAAQESGDDKTFLEVSAKLRAACVQDRSIVLLESQLLHKYDLSNGAKAILGKWVQDHSTDFPAWMVLGNIAIDTGDDELVAMCISSLVEPDAVDDDTLAGVVRLLVRSNVEPPGGTRRYLYRLWRSHRRDPRTWQALLMVAYFVPRHGQQSDADPVEVQAGATVHLQVEGQLRTLCLEDGPDPDPAWDEFSPLGDGISAILGKRCGDQVCLPGALIERKGVIVRLSRNEDAAPSRCLAQWEKHFPHVPFIQEFRIPDLPASSGPEEARRALEPMIEMARRRRERAEDVLAVYRRQPMPVWIIARALGLEELVALDALAVDGTTSIHCLGWKPNELAEQEQSLGLRVPLVVDMSAVATLMRLGVVAEFLSAFELIAPERLLGELRRLASEPSRGAGTEEHFVEEAGKLHVITHDSSRSAERQEKLSRLLDAWKATGRASDSLALSKLSKDTRLQLEEQLVGPLSARALAIAADLSFPLLSDDMAVAAIGEQLLSVTRISTAVAIEYLRKSGTLLESRASELLVKLHEWGYTGMPIRPSIFLLALERANWDISAPAVKAMLDSVLQPSQAPVPVARFLAETFRLLWRKRPVEPDASQVVQPILQQLDQRNDGRMIGRAILEAIDDLFGLDVLGAKYAKSALHRWLHRLLA